MARTNVDAEYLAGLERDAGRYRILRERMNDIDDEMQAGLERWVIDLPYVEKMIAGSPRLDMAVDKLVALEKGTEP